MCRLHIHAEPVLSRVSNRRFTISTAAALPDNRAVVFTTKPLDPSTWPDFAALAEAHDGVWNGCWCLAFHEEGKPGVHTPEQRRALKETRVRKGTAHAALVFDGDECVGWCQFGPPAELPRIKHQKAYAQGLGELPDWRITCFFVASGHRRRGVADAALAGALEQIAARGGGSVESYPEDTSGRGVSGSFLHNGSLAMFERHGFTPSRRIGKYRWVVSRVVESNRRPGDGRQPSLRRVASISDVSR